MIISCLVSILQRWKDGQHGINDYAKFDCKFRTFSDKSEMFRGDSFWKNIKMAEKLANNHQDLAPISLSEKVEMLIFKNKKNVAKSIVKISYDVPFEQVVKDVEAASFLTSVKDDDGVELLEVPAANGWKSLFPEWKAYRQLNAGFWGVPKSKKSIVGNRFSKSYVVSGSSSTLHVKGQTTFLVKTNETQTKLLKKLVLKKDGRYFPGDVYLNYGEHLHYGVSGLSDDNQHVLVAIETDIPVQSVTVYDAQTGAILGKAESQPFEFNLPVAVSEINLDVVYDKLKKVRVDYSVSQ